MPTFPGNINITVGILLGIYNTYKVHIGCLEVPACALSESNLDVVSLRKFRWYTSYTFILLWDNKSWQHKLQSSISVELILSRVRFYPGKWIILKCIGPMWWSYCYFMSDSAGTLWGYTYLQECMGAHFIMCQNDYMPNQKFWTPLWLGI